IKHAAGIAVKAVLDDGDVDVDDVAGAQLLVAWNAVAYHVVYRRADRLWIRLVARRGIVERGRYRFLDAGDVVVAQAVQTIGGRTGLDVRSHEVEHLRGQSAGEAHFLDFLGGFDADGHWTRPAPRQPGGKYLVFQGQRILVQN